MRKEAYLLAAVAAIWAINPMQASGQQWPDKAVRILVPFPPGGGTDIQARLLSSAFQKSMGQNFIIDNRTGANGLIATQLAVDSPPDGNTILFTSGSISVVVTLNAKQMKFNVHNDLAPVSWISSTPLVLSLHPSVPAKSIKEFVALAKRAPRSMNAGGNTAGSTAHLTAEMFNQVVGVNSTVVTYRGGGPAVIALISGEIDYIFATAPSVMPHLKSGKARALAVTTPKPIVDKLNAEIRKALDTPEIKAFMPREALDPVSSSPEELSALLKAEIEKYARVIRLANIRVD